MTPGAIITSNSLIGIYGYAAILIGTFVEGETILILGGFAAQRGYLFLPWVVAAAFIGSLFGDQLFFFLGRWHSQKVLAKWPSWKNRVDRAQRLVEQYKTPLILLSRFLYGLRVVVPFVIGMSRVPSLRFILLNVVGALVWAITFGTAGYLFGSALEGLIGDIRHYEAQVIGVVAFVGGLIWLSYFYRRRKHRIANVKS